MIKETDKHNEKQANEQTSSRSDGFGFVKDETGKTVFITRIPPKCVRDAAKIHRQELLQAATR